MNLWSAQDRHPWYFDVLTETGIPKEVLLKHLSCVRFSGPVQSGEFKCSSHQGCFHKGPCKYCTLPDYQNWSIKADPIIFLPPILRIWGGSFNTDFSAVMHRSKSLFCSTVKMIVDVVLQVFFWILDPDIWYCGFWISLLRFVGM